MEFISMDLPTLATAEDYYLNPGMSCRVVDAYTVLYTAITTADAVITISDGTTDVGAITITQSGCAEGDCDRITLDSTSKGSVEFGTTTPIKIELDGGPDAGAGYLTFVLDPFHVDNG